MKGKFYNFGNTLCIINRNERKVTIMLLTKEAYRQKEKELEQLKIKLQDVRKEKALHILQSPGDDRHDNFGFEQAEIQERAVIKDINDLTIELENATIVETFEDKSKQIVQVGDLVRLKLDYGNDDVFETEYRLQALPSSEEATVTLNSPIGKTIFQKEIGFLGECRIANGNKVKIQILEIN